MFFNYINKPILQTLKIRNAKKMLFKNIPNKKENLKYLSLIPFNFISL